jgi:cyclophilin family peptidyl-prolyl cis-trans isomerase
MMILATGSHLCQQLTCEVQECCRVATTYNTALTMASMSTKSLSSPKNATVLNGTKEDLASFQAKRNRWMSSPRPKLIPLPPRSPEIVLPESFGAPITMPFQSPSDVWKASKAGSSSKGKPSTGLFGSLSYSTDMSGTSNAPSYQQSSPSTPFILPSFGAPSTTFSDASSSSGQTKFIPTAITAFSPKPAPTHIGQATFPTPESTALSFKQVESPTPASSVFPMTPLKSSILVEQRGTITTTAAKIPPSYFKVPTPVGQAKPSAPAAAAFPPISTKDPTPFDTSTKKIFNDTDGNYRTRLMEFYKKYNPSKLDTIDETLQKYTGKEEELFQKLATKYAKGSSAIIKSDFPLPAGDGPLCFLKFSVDGHSVGRVVVKVYQNKTPLAAENFKCLCTGEKGIGRMGKLLCYQGSKVHRIVPQFCVQMGDFTKGNGTGGESIYPPNSQHGDAWGKFKDELFMQHSKPGLLSMANSGKNTNSSQVFFTLRPVPHLDGKHVVFGEVVEGMDVIEALGMLETDSKQKPVHPVEISECGEVGIDVPSR